jgi:uncharacterized sulfatase
VKRAEHGRAVATAILLALGFVLACGRAPAPPSSLPNFVVLLADDLTYRDIGCYGGQAFTPNLDRLAAEGLRFTSCFQAASMCAPTRACLYTGLYPVKSGAYPNDSFARPGTRSIVHALRDAGYRVALSGKSHVAPREVFPFELSKLDDGPDFAAIERLMSECVESGTPFCLFVCSTWPHQPWTIEDPERYPEAELALPPFLADTPETRSAYSRYLAEVTRFDQQVGSVLELLEELELSSSTLVLALSEHGSSFPFGKWTLYDTGIQSACLVRWPGRVAPGSESAALVEYVDVVPTLLEAAGVAAPAELDGRSFLPVLLGRAAEHKQHVFAIQTTYGMLDGSDHYGIRAVRSARFKYILNLTPEQTCKYPATTSTFIKSWYQQAELDSASDAAVLLRRFEQRPGEELYDLAQDPYEWTNLAADPALAEVKAELRAELERWMAAQGDTGQATELAARERMVEPAEGAGAGR